MGVKEDWNLIWNVQILYLLQDKNFRFSTWRREDKGEGHGDK